MTYPAESYCKPNIIICFWRGVSVIYSVDVTWINTMSDRIMIELVSFLQPTLFANT